MAEMGNILTWTLIGECPIPDDVNDLLVEGKRQLLHIRHSVIVPYLLTRD